MPSVLRGLLGFMGRLLLCVVFLTSAIGENILHYPDTLEKMKDQNVPYPQILLPGAIAFLLLGSLSVIVGFKARFGALLLLVFLGMATYYFHSFWNVPLTETALMERAQIDFMKNLSMAGAMLFIIGNGSGYGSLDGRDVEQPRRP